MTRARLSRRARERFAEQQRAAEHERQLAAIERDVAILEQLATQALLVETAWRKGRLSEARYKWLAERLWARLRALDPVDAEQPA